MDPARRRVRVGNHDVELTSKPGGTTAIVTLPVAA